MGNCETVFKQARRVAAQNLKTLKEATEPPMTSPSIPNDEIVEAAKNEWFNPTKPLRDETEGERFMRIVKQALADALAAMPGGVDWRKVLLDDEPSEEMRHYAHTAYAASGDLMEACRAFVRAAPLTPSAIRAEGLVLVRKELLDDFPEINPNNYNDDDVRALNQWGINLVLAAAPTPPTAQEGK